MQDTKVITDVVSAYDGNIDKMLIQLKRIFNKDITVAHYMVMGAVVGFDCATEIERTNKLKQLSLCQRVN